MDVNHAAYQPAPYRLTDPVLRYQLDPGEPGLLRSARASDSIAAVSAQERGNLNQFRREAFLAGRVIIRESITFTRGIDGLFNTIRAGLTEVVSIPAPSLSSSTDIEDAEFNPEMGTEIEVPATSAEELANDIQMKEIELLTRLSALKNTIKQAKALAEKVEGEISTIAEVGITDELEDIKEWDLPRFEMPPEEASATDPEEALPQTGLRVPEEEDAKVGGEIGLPAKKHISEKMEFESLKQDEVVRHEQEIRELNEKLKELQTLRLRANIAQISEVMLGAIQENVNLLSKLVSVANHVGPDSHFNDPSSNVPILGMTLDFSV